MYSTSTHSTFFLLRAFQTHRIRLLSIYWWKQKSFIFLPYILKFILWKVVTFFKIYHQLFFSFQNLHQFLFINFFLLLNLLRFRWLISIVKCILIRVQWILGRFLERALYYKFICSSLLYFIPKLVTNLLFTFPDTLLLFLFNYWIRLQLINLL